MGLPPEFIPMFWTIGHIQKMDFSLVRIHIPKHTGLCVVYNARSGVFRIDHYEVYGLGILIDEWHADYEQGFWVSSYESILYEKWLFVVLHINYAVRTKDLCIALCFWCLLKWHVRGPQEYPLHNQTVKVQTSLPLLFSWHVRRGTSSYALRILILRFGRDNYCCSENYCYFCGVIGSDFSKWGRHLSLNGCLLFWLLPRGGTWTRSQLFLRLKHNNFQWKREHIASSW